MRHEQGSSGDAQGRLGVGCETPNPNCPPAAELGPDFDFGNAPMLAAIAGRDMIGLGQKSAIGWALDPDTQGAVMWQYRAGQRACEEITLNAETAETAEKNPRNSRRASRALRQNVVFFHRLQSRTPRTRTMKERR